MTRAGESTVIQGAGEPRGIPDLDEGHTTGGRTPLSGAGPQGRHVCPFCGSVNDTLEGPCPRCTMENTAETRKATKSRIGPWYVLQSRNPAAPGMTHDTLLGFVRKGRVKARSIVRGPTTHQLWRFACQVKGLSREFGVCYSCGGTIEREAHLCPQCNRLQDPPANPDVFLEEQAAVNSAAGPVAAAAGAAAEINAARSEPARPPVYRELKIPAVNLADEFAAPPAAAAIVATPPPAAPAPVPVPAAAPAAALQASPAAPSPTTAPAPAPPANVPAPAATSAPPSGRRKASDVFLSAKDLAAAFQLDFKPDPDSEAAARPRAGLIAGADRALPWPPRRRRRKRRVGRYVLLLMLVAVCAFGAYLAIDAHFRQQALDWANEKYMSLTGANLYPDIAAPRARPRATSNPASLRALPATAATQRPEPKPATQADPNKPQRSPFSLPAAATASSQPAPSATGRAGIPRTASAATRPVVAATQPLPAAPRAPAPAPRFTLQDAQQRAKLLYGQALDADADGDFAKAARIYKQIMDELPRQMDGQDVWPGDVQLRYGQARKLQNEK